MIIKNYEAKPMTKETVLRIWKNQTRYDQKRFQCPFTNNDVVSSSSQIVALQLNNNVDYMNFVSFDHAIVDRFRAYIQSTQTPMILDIDSCTDPNFQFALAYSLTYGSRAYDFYRWAENAVSVEQLAKQIQILWTEDWTRKEVDYENRVVTTFDVDYIELAKLFWYLAGRTEPVKRLTFFQYTLRRISPKLDTLVTVVQNVHSRDKNVPDDQPPRYKTNGNSIVLDHDKTLVERKFLPIPQDVDIDVWIRELMKEYVGEPGEKTMNGVIGIADWSSGHRRFKYRHEHDTRIA